jgi:hypothetical protein
MNGIELDKTELAYLLATVGAKSLIGVDDPKLVPSTAKAQETTFGKGRKQLEANGWIKLVEGKPGEYDLNPGLFHAVAIMAAPEMVVATRRGAAQEDGQVVLHYLVRDLIVELWATAKGYFLGRLPDRETLGDRIVEFLGLAEESKPGELRLPEATFDKIQGLAQKGEVEEASRVLDSADVNGRAGKALIASLASPSRGQLVVARAGGGEIEAGRRAMVFGEKKAAWMAIRPEAGAKELRLSPVGAAELRTLVGGWLKELGRPA